MSTPVITVEHLTKAYRLGLKGDVPDTFVETVGGWIKAPLTNYRRLRRLDISEIDLNGSNSLEAGTAPIGDLLFALRDVSFEIQEGDVVGIVGRNGAGKSTLLKVLSRITDPTRGRAIIHGRVGSLLEVGTGFHPELTGRENIYLDGAVLGMTKREIDRRFDEIVAFSGVERFLDTPIKRYSSGMQVRLAFAVAAHMDPEILIVDEVLAVGDIEFQRKCLGKLHDAAKVGRTVLFVSHNLAPLEVLCNVGLEMEGGRLISSGRMQDVAASYRTRVFERPGEAVRHFPNATLVSKVELIDGNGAATSTLSVGMTLSIRITFKAPLKSSHRIYVGINDQLGQRVLTLQPPVSMNLSGTTVITGTVIDFPLAPGMYSVAMHLLQNREEIDRIMEAVRITVADGELFGEGRGFEKGVCVARASWS